MKNRNVPAPNVTLSEGFEGMRSDYTAAKLGRFRRRRTGISSMGSGADYHYRSEADFLRMLEYARDMDRNDAVVGQTVDRAVVNTVQDGIKVDPNTGDKSLDKDLSALWKDWAEHPDQCDIQGEMAFCDLERLALRSTIVDGDIIALLTRSGRIQMIEGHRVRTPRSTTRNVVHGVLLDQLRNHLEYWITREDIDPLRSVAKVSEIRPFATRDDDGNRQVAHVYNPKRVSQTRGVTAFAPIFDTMGMGEDIFFAKLVQQQIVSCFAIIREVEEGATVSDEQLGDRETESLTGGSGVRTIDQISPGMDVTGDPGEKIKGFSPGVPNAEFFEHAKMIMSLIGANIGMPLVMMLMDASETNFSGYRGAVDQARLGFKDNQRWLVSRFHRPVYLWKVRQWMNADPSMAAAALRTGVDMFGHRWNPPTWPYIEPKKDAEADLVLMANGVNSRRRVHASRGRDVREVDMENIEDNSFAIIEAKKVAMKINEAFDDGQPVHWNEIVTLPSSNGGVAMAAPVPDEEDEDEDEDEDEQENEDQGNQNGERNGTRNRSRADSRF